MNDISNPNRKKIIRFLLTLLKAVYLFMPGIFFLMAYYFIIIVMPIGQDMLMHAAENPSPYFWTVISIIIWMLFSWYSSRLIADVYEAKNNPPYRTLFVHFPRLVGYNVAVCLQLAILNLPTIAALSKGLLVLLVAHNLFYFLLERTMNKQTKKLFIISSLVAMAYIIYLIIIFPKKTTNVGSLDKDFHLKGCFAMIIIFFVFQIVFVALVVWRRKLLERGRFKNSGKGWRRTYDWLSIATLLLYILILESEKFANGFGALGVALLAFGLWVGFICLLKNFSIKANTHFGLPLLVLAIIYGVVFPNPYKVRLQKTDKANLFSSRPNLDQFLNNWLNNNLRKSEIQKADTHHRFIVYAVIADGGASKSGYWVASVLSKLEEGSNPNDRFSKHLLSLAGASGGSVGNAAFYCLLRENMKTHSVNFSNESMGFFRGDFLTSSFARFVGPDLFGHILPFIRMDDRAVMLEKSMEDISYSPLIGDDFKENVDIIFDREGTLPALFINTTNLQSGTPGVVSNIRLDAGFTQRMDILQLIDTTHEPNGYNNINLSTAVVLGARFPYISPAGEINGKYFVDGGYFDNSGGGITLEMLQYIESKMNDATDTVLTKFKDKLKFKVIYISNGNGEKKADKKLNPLLNDAAAPLLTVLGTYGKQTSFSNQKLESFMHKGKLDTAQKPFDTLNLPIGYDSISYPMNWVISQYNLNRMKENLQQVKPGEVLR